MRVVVDTNVLVSGLLNPHGPPGRIIDLAVAGQIAILYDDRILSEYRAVLQRPRFGFDIADIQVLLGYLEQQGESVLALPVKLELDDPDDLPFLEVAVAGFADALVTGNVRHFRPRSGKHRVKVLTPRKFCELA
jgi:putative PIN family toxin of toxin-antitoxin system